VSLLNLDSRWRRFNDETRACPCCGQRFNGIFDIGLDLPDDWPHPPREDQPDVILGDDRLGAELCRLDGRHFLRAVLTLPLRGADDTFSFGPWVEVSAEVFAAYRATFDNPNAAFGPAEGLLANALPGFEAEIDTPVALSLPDRDQRPQLRALDGPLAQAQEQGVSFDDLLDIYAASGMDIRPHLTTD
jgi:hypothetical protein